MKKENIGSSLDDWLREEGIYEETSETAMDRVLRRLVSGADAIQPNESPESGRHPKTRSA